MSPLSPEPPLSPGPAVPFSSTARGPCTYGHTSRALAKCKLFFFLLLFFPLLPASPHQKEQRGFPEQQCPSDRLTSAHFNRSLSKGFFTLKAPKARLKLSLSVFLSLAAADPVHHSAQALPDSAAIPASVPGALLKATFALCSFAQAAQIFGVRACGRVMHSEFFHLRLSFAFGDRLC